uniref:Uncharacterized protein n=1 Tax=Caloglossa beccarii TaxID=131038 RepID=A0A1Z1M9B3_9FLOR|nr:hypothetical protein [Caloglossa beccarii]ARW62355.1 hypothetical protein [Caloglossa beccarii]
MNLTSLFFYKQLFLLLSFIWFIKVKLNYFIIIIMIFLTI